MEVFLTQLPAAIALVLIIFKLVLDFLKEKGSGGPRDTSNGDLQRMQKQIADLHQWHDKEDEDGVKIWYVRRSLEEAIVAMTKAIENQTRVLEACVSRLEKLDSDVERLDSDVKGFKEKNFN